MKRTQSVLLTGFTALGVMASGIAFAQEGDDDRDGQRPRRGGDRGPQGGGNPIMMALDADKDGEISTKEMEGAAAALKKLDKNEDGKLTGEEIRPPRRGGRDGAQRGGGAGGGRGGFNFAEMIMRNDANDDGKVSKDELPERMQRMMERADEDGDGFITKAEAEKLATSFGGRGGGRGGRGGDGGGTRPQRPQRPD